MKKFILLSALVPLMIFGSFAQVAINTDGSLPDVSAMMDVQSTEQGFLPPRMNTIQREAISSPATGLVIYNTDSASLEFWNGMAWYDIASGGSYTPPLPVQGSCPDPIEYWMDRNLGASQVATSMTDYLGYGSLFQWGRAAEGHEIINWTSSTGSDGAEQANETGTLATTALPNLGNTWDGLFITSSDWLVTQDDNLWQGVSGSNNPCPPAYRLPTETEWDCELTNWSSNNVAGAYASPLKLPVASYRYYSSGSLNGVGAYGYYWSCTVDGVKSRSLYFSSSLAGMYSNPRAIGFSVRCIKD